MEDKKHESCQCDKCWILGYAECPRDALEHKLSAAEMHARNLARAVQGRYEAFGDSGPDLDLAQQILANAVHWVDLLVTAEAEVKRLQNLLRSEDLALETWAVAQLTPQQGIEDGVSNILNTWKIALDGDE